MSDRAARAIEAIQFARHLRGLILHAGFANFLSVEFVPAVPAVHAGAPEAAPGGRLTHVEELFGTADVYRDTDARLHRDADFHGAVTLVAGLARSHGFTPGELKQVAFAAALEVEETRVEEPRARLPYARNPGENGGF